MAAGLGPPLEPLARPCRARADPGRPLHRAPPFQGTDQLTHSLIIVQCLRAVFDRF